MNIKPKEIWLCRKDIEKMLEVLDKHPDFDRNFRLIYSSCAIGSVIDMELSYKGVFEQVNIVSEQEW